MAHFAHLSSGHGVNLDLVVTYEDHVEDPDPAKWYCKTYYNRASEWSSETERWYGTDRTELLQAMGRQGHGHP
jgi:hypothetical protein